MSSFTHICYLDLLPDLQLGSQRNILTLCVFYSLSTLLLKEFAILCLRNGFIGDKTYTFEEIGHLYKVTRERIRQIEAKAIRKIHSRYWRIEEQNLNEDIIMMELSARLNLVQEFVKKNQKNLTTIKAGNTFKSAAQRIREFELKKLRESIKGE